MTRAALALILASASTLMACGDATDTGTSPTDPTMTTEHFSGSLAVGGLRFFSFTVTGDGAVAVTLASVTNPASGLALTTPLNVGLGIPVATGCSVKRRVTTPPGLVAQINDSTIPGVYCVEIADAGALTAPVNFSARFTHP